MEGAHTTQSSKTAGLPSPPSSVKAGTSEIESNDNDSQGANVDQISGEGSSTRAKDEADPALATEEKSPDGKSLKVGQTEEASTQDKASPPKSGRSSPTKVIDVPNDSSSGESEGEIVERLRDDTLYTSRKQLPKRIKKAPKLVLQQMEYSRLLEDRVRDMERRLNKIENKGIEPEASAPSSPKETHTAGLILGIKSMSFQEYLPPKRELQFGLVSFHKRRHEFPGQDTFHLIDVVVSNSHQSERLRKEQNANQGASHPDRAFTGLADSSQEVTTRNEHLVQPDRIRINSSLLLKALENITDSSFTTADFGSGGKNSRELSDQVILRPFKVLVTHEQKIRDAVARLEEKHKPIDNGNKAETAEKGLNGSATPKDQNEEVNTFIDVPKNDTPESTDPLESKRCLDELTVLRELLENHLKPTFDLRKQIQDGVARTIAFQDLWHLFPIGGEVVSNDAGGENQVYRILNVSGGRPFLCTRDEADMPWFEPVGNEKDLPKFEILCYFYDSDGKDLGACERLITIRQYDGDKVITSLPCYPLMYSKNARGLKPRDFFIERGKRYIELTRRTDIVHKRYDGLTLVMDELREEVDSEVIIDVSMALLKNSITVSFGVTRQLESDSRETMEFLDSICHKEGCCQNTAIHKDSGIKNLRSIEWSEQKNFLRDFIEPDDYFSDEDYMVCPCWVYGYALRSRKWVKLEVRLVDDIDDVESGRTGFDSLVLPPGHRETLLALVQTHSKGKTLDIGLKAEKRQMDLVRGKGKGLIILLHGEPGVGKSSTAESIAEYTHRPLFQVTCGDIGESADEVEERLENHFQLAHRWGCVLLLDEADVFLEARSKTDLKRNAIVSVFLRVLEYYSGILFLTTNRVGAFDQAFRSRIHMSLFYPKVDEETTVKIWEMNINRAKEIWGEKLSIDDDDHKAILRFASTHYQELLKSEATWNGRQIRNAFQTAIALAEWDAHTIQVKYKSPIALKPKLEKSHFERVAKASKHFDAYLKETQAGSAASLASDNRERKDDFPSIGS